jgi:hypothetical protein
VEGRASNSLIGGFAFGTTSYAKAMQAQMVSAKVDEAAAGLFESRQQAMETLRQRHAVGVVVALRGEVIWADLFSDTDLLTRYWMKLVRSYVAEVLTTGSEHKRVTIADAQQFWIAHPLGARPLRGDWSVPLP